MAVAVLLVGGLGRDLDALERDERREQVERGVPERAEYRYRAGAPGGVPLQCEQDARHGDARQRRARGERDDPLAVGLGHGSRSSGSLRAPALAPESGGIKALGGRYGGSGGRDRGWMEPILADRRGGC